MHFKIRSKISNIQTIAAGTNIREVSRLRKTYGLGRWLKRKGTASILLADGSIFEAEIHWYEASGIGRKEYKIKHLL